MATLNPNTRGATPDSWQSALGGRIAAVTGASAGIGRAITIRLLDSGARVAANARRGDLLDALATATRDEGGAIRLRVVAGDVADPETREQVGRCCREEFGAMPDIIVVSAGRGLPGTLLSSDAGRWREIVELNVVAVLEQLRWAGRLMSDAAATAARSGVQDIVVLGSVVGRTGSTTNPVYAATKAAVHSATEALRHELAPRGIRVTLIEPGFVETEFQRAAGYDLEAFTETARAIGPLLTADDVAAAVTFVLSRPPHVHLSDLVLRPTRQAAP